jgi:Flp pilus assembly protein TadG
LRKSFVGRSRRAAATVELAVLLPLFMSLLFGIWEVGRFADAMMILQGGAREGARQAAAGSRIDPVTGLTTNIYASPQGGSSPPDVTTAVINYLQAQGCTTTNVTVTFTNLTPGASTVINPSTGATYADKNDPFKANRLDQLQVTVTIPYKDVRWSPTQLFINYNQVLTATVNFNSNLDLPFTVNTTIPQS